MEKIVNAMYKFAREEEGVTIIEYALMAALIGLGVAATVFTLQGDLKTLFGKISSCVKTPSTGC
jgi:pilus assembly protein Flp/PilA